ncbi:hypothetical protein [Paenibacillus mendelii]|uniref:Uncharacterized protein n=1 Tax=Paenibacillus mendelii TaxID=206163 RepID=A0ABV6J1U7_9BACL|nr:hypothetical protein [Paenibacillus mendelii]MCQ6562776.1 hypothetical protein [Paenibacillus mendelii]
MVRWCLVNSSIVHFGRVFEECSFEGAIFHHSSLAGSRFVGETDKLPIWGDTIVTSVKINGEALI